MNDFGSLPNLVILYLDLDVLLLTTLADTA